ncbi:MAG: AAA family ATPase [Thermoguttaceae bacterium]|nr:AAA family ATPase [Thermoguttaceae bacterium]
MRIDKISLSPYGEKRKLDLTFRAGNFSLVYGENEAGKSTLLNFIRNMLFGNQTKSGDSKAPFVTNFSIARGEMEFQLSDHRRGHITRQWNVDKKVIVCEQSKLTLASIEKESSELGHILGCSNHAFYESFFGFSYEELMKGGELLAQSELLHLLYGMAAGDADLLKRMQKTFQERLNALFLPGPNAKKLINERIIEYEKLKKQTEEKPNLTKNYKDKIDEKKELENQIASAESASIEAQRETDYWSTALAAHPAFIEYQSATSDFQGLCDSPEGFAQLISRLTEEEEEEYREAKQTVKNENDEIDEISADIFRRETELAKIDLDYAKQILDYESAINELTSNKTLFEDKNSGLANRRNALHEHEKELVRELAELGALRLDASEEERRAVVQSTRDLLLGSILDECQENKEKEEQAKQSLNEFRIKSEQETTNFEGKKLAYKKKLEEFNFEFEDWALNLSIEDVRETASEINKVVAEYNELVKEYDVLKNALAEEESFAREILRQANDGDECLDDLVAELTKPVKPLEYAALANEMEALEQERNRLEREIIKLDDDINKTAKIGQFDQNKYDSAVKELKIRRRQRDEQWKRVQNNLTEHDETPIEDRLKLAKSYRCEEEAVDHASDRLFELNRARGESDAYDAKLKELRLNRDEQLSALDELKEQIAALDDKAAALWERFGFGRCARWSIAESVTWLESWEKWRDLHTKNELKSTSLVDKITRCERTFVADAKVLGRWVALECDVVALDQDYLSQSALTRRVEILNEMARVLVDSRKKALSRAERYGVLCSDLKNLSNIVSELEVKVATYNREIEKIRAELAELTSKCAIFCTERGLTFFESTVRDWRALTDAVRRLRDWQKEMNEYDVEREKYDADVSFVGSFVDKAAKLATIAFRESRDALVDVQRLASGLKDARDDETKYNTTEKELAKRREDLEAKVAARNKAQEHATEIRERTGLDDDAFGRFLTYVRSYRQKRDELDNKRKILQASLHENLGTSRAERFLADLKENDYCEIQRKCEEKKAYKDRISQFVIDLRKRHTVLDGEIKALENAEKPMETLGEVQKNLAQLREYVDEYAPLKIANEFIERSLKNFQGDKMDDILERASEILKEITNGRYYKIEEIESKQQKSKETKEYIVLENTGQDKKKEQLSSGTRAQLYLALRLALIAEYDEHSEPLPVLMDDVLVNSDETRARRILEVLAEMATEQRQIILLSCHKSTRDAFVEIVGAENAIELESGLK